MLRVSTRCQNPRIGHLEFLLLDQILHESDAFFRGGERGKKDEPPIREAEDGHAIFYVNHTQDKRLFKDVETSLAVFEE